MAKTKHVDVLVIGGGVNGAGIARDLAGRGLSVMLCEKNDLASATSSASTKLIHGGLRYLEQYEFKLVREALHEREVLLQAAPHIIWPLTFLMPHNKDLRPRWMIRTGLLIYDFLGGKRTLPGSRARQLPGSIFGLPLKTDYRHGFTYSDCWVEDTRLVVLAAVDAADKGAEVRTRTEVTGLAKNEKAEGWTVSLRNNIDNTKQKVHADLVVNASGPWVSKTLDMTGSEVGKYRTRWVKGSHIIVPRIYQGEHAYILQNDDRRIVFIIPYEKKYSLVGTTDIEYKGDIEEVRITLEEVEYLCAAANKYLRHPLKPEDVQWAYSGVRPLVDDGEGNASEVTRDYILEMEDYKGAPILSVYGGKLTTFRKLSEQAGDKIVAALQRGGAAWTEGETLPGGECGNFDTFLKTLKREYNWLPEALAHRLVRAYGARVRDMVRGMKRIADMGEHFGDGVYGFEVDYLVRTEWAMTLEDVLWRRSKLGLHTREETQKKIRRHLKRLLNAGAEEE